MKINAILYKEMSDAADTVHLETGLTVAENFPDVDFKHRIIINNGKQISENHKVREDDHIIIRSTPSGATAAVIALIVVAVAVAIVVGVALYMKKKAAQKKTDDRKDVKDEVKDRPFLKGATNGVATSKTQPYFIGECLFTPYVMNSGGNNYKGFTTISGTDGNDQYYNVVLEGGFNKQVFRKLFCDDVILKTFDATETEPQEGIYDFDESSVFYDEDSKIEIAQDGNPFETDILNYKIVEQQSNNQLLKSDDDNYKPLTFVLEKSTMSVDLCISFGGLIQYTDEGYKRPRTVVVKPYYSLDNGATWTEFFFDQNGTPNNTFTRQTLNQIRFVAHADFVYDDIKDLELPIQVKVECETRAFDGSKYDDCYVEWVQSRVYNPDKSKEAGEFVAEKVIDSVEAAQSALIGLRIKSTADNEDKLSKVNFVSSGIARIYDSENEEWTTSKVPTSNPAAWLIEVMTSDTHAPSKTEDEEIDFASFAELYQYCETEGYRIDMVLTDGQTKQSLLADVCNVCDCMLYQDIYGKIAVAIDTYKPNAVALFNSQNIINIEYNKEFARETDGIKCTYVNREADFVEDTYLVMRDGHTRNAESILREMQLKGITTHEHVVKNARRLMATAELRPTQVNIEVGKEGVYFTPFSKILIQNNELKIGLGHAEIKAIIVQNNNIIGLELYEPIEYDSEDENGFGVVINCVGEDYCRPLSKAITAQASGRVTELLFVEPIALNATTIPHAGDVLSYGYLNNGAFDTITTPFLIAGVEPTSNGYRMTCVNYNEAIYDTGTIPEYTPNLTQPRTPPQAIPKPSDTVELLNELSVALVDGTKNVGAPDIVSNIRALANKDTIEISCGAFTLGLKNSIDHVEYELKKDEDSEWETLSGSGLTASYVFDRSVDGYPEADELTAWQIRAKAKNIYGEWSENYGYTTVNTSGYGTWTLTQPSVMTRVSDRTITLIMSPQPRGDNKTVYGTIRYKVQIKRPDIDSEWFTPNTSGNPYPATGASNEYNYKLTSHAGAESDEVYSQTMPLKGQPDDIYDTAYSFRVICYSEASTSEAVEVTATALCTSIRDIVKANETVKSSYISQLSALSANVGTIFQGAFGRNLNFWDLSTFIDDYNHQHYEGAFRVGGENQYLQVEPIVQNGIITDYNIKFVVGSFELSATASNINGELIVQDNNNSLDRTKITPKGTFFQHRDTTESAWYSVAYSHTNGHMSSQFFSDKNVYFTNQSMSERRLAGYDIGAAMPSSDARVFHFDENLLDQHGENGLTITDSESGYHMLVGADDSSDDLDCTPAILAIAPYATIGKALYGQYSLSLSAGSAGNYTVDFWIQYIFAENQVLFNVGTPNEQIKLIQGNGECYLYELEEDTCPFFEEMVMSRLFFQLTYHETCLMYEDSGCPMYDTEYDMFDNRVPDESYHSDWKYYERTENEQGEIFTLLDINEGEFFAYIDNIWVKTCNYNEPRGTYEEIQHIINGTIAESKDLADAGVVMISNEWVHFGIVADNEKLCACINKTSVCFDRVEFSGNLSVSLNENKNSFMLDELLVDTTTAEDKAAFKINTDKRIPFGSLNSDENWFILSAHDTQKVKTNLFETDAFTEAVEGILSDKGLI